jgi:hypothetical protein
MFPHAVTARQILSRDILGAPTAYGSGQVIYGRCVNQHRQVQVSGVEKKSAVTMYVAGVYGLTIDYELSLPAQFSPASPEPIAVNLEPDENGSHHEVVYFA